MRQDIRALQRIVIDHLRENKLTQEEFASRGGPELTRGKLGYLINGNATTIDIALLAAYAQALRIPFSTLAARIDVIGATAATSREAQLLAEAQSVSEQLEGTQKDIFLDAMEQAVERAKASLRA
ncbi:hypothetical protein [Ktedonospora formicarum]|uniref:HTH cro/C1-type domain-containing protein n=1 Tax=Ktedonospora formicarum TaxID=2778364 RepID=A0A8J3MSS5_9CHLR|nr:hypothetical protein [Ktedonospora formicarum]GHO45161.1 hypothetical protein KSX_33240 [Ktedonospora formicarum]